MIRYIAAFVLLLTIPAAAQNAVCLLKEPEHPNGHFASCSYAECMKEPQANFTSRTDPANKTMRQRPSGGILGGEFGRIKWADVADGVRCLKWCKDDTSIECVPQKGVP